MSGTLDAGTGCQRWCGPHRYANVSRAEVTRQSFLPFNTGVVRLHIFQRFCPGFWERGASRAVFNPGGLPDILAHRIIILAGPIGNWLILLSEISSVGRATQPRTAAITIFEGFFSG